jgi:DNA-binding NtrC family response regulator
MPPLREHKDDIPLLVSFFVEKNWKKCSARQKPLSKEALDCLMNYDWPGNVRELENVVERALVLGTSDDILVEDLPESLLERAPAPGMNEAKYHSSVKELKKRLIQSALEAHDYTGLRLLGVIITASAYPKP